MYLLISSCNVWTPLWALDTVFSERQDWFHLVAMPGPGVEGRRGQGSRAMVLARAMMADGFHSFGEF